jgi:hypothetical protein
MEPWLCRTSAFSLINRLGNRVVVTFFFFFTDPHIIAQVLPRDPPHLDMLPICTPQWHDSRTSQECSWCGD